MRYALARAFDASQQRLVFFPPVLMAAPPPEAVAGSARAWLAAVGPWLLVALAGAAAAVGLAWALYRRHGRLRQEERFGAFFEAAPGALLLLDGERRVAEANEAACTLMGRGLARLRGRRLDDLLETDGGAPPKTAFEAIEAAQGGEADEASQRCARTEARVERPDGTERQVRLHLRALTVEGQRHTAATLQDMTAVSEEHAFFKGFHRRTVQDLPIELAVLSPEGTYLYANPMACTDNISPQWLEGKTDFELCRRLGVHPEVALRRRSHRRRALQSGERVQFSEVLSRRDAPPHHVERFYTPVFGGEGEIHAVVTYALDQTRLRRREEALAKAERTSEDYEEMKTTLLRNLRHEFRTPLTSILGAAEVLGEDVPPEHQDFVELVHLNGQRLLRMLNAMLDLAGTQTGSLDQRPRVLSASAAVEAVIEELQETAEQKGLFLRAQAPPAPDAFVRVDPARLYRVLRSVIGNAVKFTQEGGVVVETGERDGRTEIRVIDTGVGIEESYLPQLFESFGQEDGSMTRGFEGTGVGLAVARRLLNLMGGAVSVDSEKGEGSAFTLSLPVAFQNADGERPRVLVAEEQPDQEKLLRHRLGDQVRLAFARTLEGALEAARDAAARQPFAAVFVSASLSPDIAAADLASRFRAIEGYEETPLVVIDEDALPGAAEQFEADGYDGYVARPLQQKALLDVLGDALAGAASATAPAASRPSA